MTSYRAPPPYHERKHSWDESGLVPRRRDHEDYLYGDSHTGYCVDSGRPQHDQDENYLENGRRDYVEYRDDNPDLREREGNYRHFEREDRKTPLLQDFRRSEESARDPCPESSRNSRFHDNLEEYIREQRELMSTDYMPRGKKPGARSVLDLEPQIYEDDRSRDYDRGHRSRGYMPEERSRDYGHRSRHDDSDGDYRCGDYSDDYRRDESRSRMEELQLDYRDHVAPRRRDYHRQPARNDPYYQRDCRNEHDMRDEDILYSYHDRHRRCNESEFRKQMNEYNSHERANSLERDRGRRGREYSYVDRDKYPISSRMVHNERPTRSDVRSYDNEPQRGTERVEPRCKRERRSSREEYVQYPSRQTRRARGGRPSRSPGIPSKAYFNSSSPARTSPTSSGRASTREKHPKRKMSMYELNGTKRRKCDGRQTNASPKKPETPSTELITRDQFLSRDVFNSKKHSSHEPEDKSTKTKDLGFRDSTSSRHSCGERDLRHELSESRAAASRTKSPHLGDSSDFEERSSTASSTRIIDNESSAIRSIVRVPKKKLQEPNESRAKIKKEVEMYSDSAQTKMSITTDPVIKPLVKQVSTPSSAEALPVNTASGQAVRTSEGLKRKVSICPTRTPSPLVGAVEKPKVDLPADDLRLLIMSRRLRQSEETSPSLDDNLNHKNEEPTMLPQMDHPQCQVSTQSQGSADGMVELSYSDPEGSANEDSAPPTPKGQACRTVVMRRQVILDYGHQRGHPRSPHRSPDEEKGKENKVDKEKYISGTNAVVEVVSQGAANPPVLTNRPLYKDDDSKILSTVEVVDNSPAFLDSHAADESQTSEESIRDVTSYEVENSFFRHATADAANSSVVYTQKYGYLLQIEDVSNQDYNGPASVEGEHFEESNGTWTTSTEQQTYQELGRFEEESDAVRENTSVPHEDEQQSVSHFDQEFFHEVGHCQREGDAGREDLPDYNGEEQYILNYGQEYSQELVYNTEVGEDLREDPPECYEEQHIPQYEQEYSQELVYNTEVGDDLREDPPECYEEQHIPQYEQEYSQELIYNTEVGDDLREDPPECYEEQHIPQYEQEYSQELIYNTEVGDDLREDPPECYEEQHIPQYEQEYSQQLVCSTEVGDDIREDSPECYDEQHLPQYEQEYSQELIYNTDVGDDLREDPPECYGEQHIPQYEQEYSQELVYNTEESDHAREDALENLRQDQSISHYEQESHQELGGFPKEGGAVQEGYSEHYDDPSTPQYERPSYLEHDYFQKERDAWRKNSLEERPEQESVSHYKQEYSQVLGSCNDENDDAGKSTSECYEEQQPVPHYKQGISQDVGKQDGPAEIRQNSPESDEEDQQVLHSEKEADNSDSTDKDNESSLETFQEEKDDNAQKSFSELEQFAGMKDSVSDGSSEKEDLSCDYDDESSETGDDDKSFSSGEDSYQSTTDEDKNCLKEDTEKEHENQVSERRHESCGNVISEASFSGYKTSGGSEGLLTSSHQYEHASERFEYDDDSEEEIPEMSNGFDVILALDGVDYDETDDDMKQANSDFDKRGVCRQDEVGTAGNPQGEGEITQVHGHGFLHEVNTRDKYDEKHDVGDKHDVIGTNIAEMEDEGRTQSRAATEESMPEFTPIMGKEDLNQSQENPADDKIATTNIYEHSASECDGIGRSDEDPDASKEDVNVSDEAATQDNGGASSYDSSNECGKRGIPDDCLDTGTEESDQTGQHHSEIGNEKCQESDGCEIQHLGQHFSPCNSGETEAQKSRPADLKWSSVSEHDDGLPTRDYDRGNANENVEQQQSNQSTDLLNKSSGSEYDPALPTKDSGCVNKQNGGHALQEANPSSDLLNRSSGSEYDPALPTKDPGTLSKQKIYAGGEDDLEKLNHPADVLNMSSTSSEYDPSLPTKDYGNIGIETTFDGYKVMRQSNHTADILNISTSSGSEYDPGKPTRDNVSSQVTHLVIDSQELRHLADRYKSSSSEHDTISTKDCDVTMEEDDHDIDDAFQELPRPDQDLENCRSSKIVACMPAESGVTHEEDYRKDDLDKVSVSGMDLHSPKNDCAVTNEQGYYRQNVAQGASHPVHCGKSNGSESVYMFRNDVTNEQDYRSDDVIHNISSPDDNKSRGSENVRISANDCDVVNEQNYHGIISKSSGSATIIHTPTNDYDVTKEQVHDSDDVIHDLRSSGSETDGQVVTKYCDVEFVRSNHGDDVIQVSQSTDCEMTDEQHFQGKDVTQELRQPDLNESVGDNPPLQSKIDNIRNSDELMEVAYPGSLGTITKKVGAHQSQAESNVIPVVHRPLDAQECVIVSCNSDTTSSYEVVVEEECRVLGATAEIFLPSDIDTNHICIYECVDFQLLCVHYTASTTGDQGPKQLYHNLQTDIGVRQKDLPSVQMTPANSQGSSNSTVAASVLREECVIEEGRVVQNQVQLICSPINDEDQISSQEESSRSLLNSVEATSQNAVECESDEHGDPVDEENSAVTLPNNNPGISQKCRSSRRENRIEIDDPDLIYLDEVQYFEGEQPIGKSENTGKAKNSSQNNSTEDVSDDTCGSKRCDSSNDSAGEMSLFSTETNVSKIGSSTSQSEMMLRLRQEFDRWTQNDEQQGSDYLFTETNYSCLSDSSDAAIQDQPYDPECASLNQASFSDMSSDAVAQPYDPECASLNQASFSDMSSDAVAQPYDPECVSLSDMSLETPSTSSQVSPKCSQVPSYVSLKTQRAVSAIRASSSKPSPCDISLYSQSTSARVPNMHEDSDLKSRKPYDPANCLMDVDTFSELSGMSLDTPSTSAVEYAATEADTTLVGIEDDDSDPYTPEAYSRSPENDSEPYTPEAYSPVLSLSGDESDPELFSCRYMDDSSTPYNPASHCPADMSMSGASGNEADNEVSTGFSSPEFSSNERKQLSLKLKKPSAQKLRWSYVGNSSKESSNDDNRQKNPEVHSPESFVPLFKPAAGGKSSSRKSTRLHSRSKSDDVERRKQQKAAPKDKECSVENEKPCALPKSLPSSSKKSERSRGKERKSKEEHTTTGSKRKPLKSLVTVVGTNKKVKKDEVKEKVNRHAGTKTKKKSATKDHNSKAIPKIPKEKESIKRPAVSETNETETTRERSTPPLKKPKLSSRSPIERRHSPGSTDSAHQHKKKPLERRNSREEKFKKPVNPGKCQRRRRSSERAKDAGQKKTTRKSSEVRRKGCSKAGSSFPVLDKLKTIMKDKSSKGRKSPESSPATKSTPTKAEENIDELHLLDEGHELLELALEESINRSRADKSVCAKRSLNLAEKVDKMKRKLAETEEMSGNGKMNSTQSFKPSEQETQVQLASDLDNAADKGVGKAAKTLSEASLDTLKAANQNSPVRLMHDNCKSTELAVKCSGGEGDAIDGGVGTGSKKNNKDLGKENTMGVAFQENDDCGWVTRDNDVPANKNVVSSAIEKLEDLKAAIQSANVTELRPTRFQETLGEPVEVNIVSSENEKKDGDGHAGDKENRLATSTNPGSARSEETGKILIADKSSSRIKEHESDTVGGHDHKTREISDPLNMAKEDSESDINSCKDNHQEIPAEDSVEVSEEVTNTLAAFSVISSPTSNYLSHGKSSHKVCGQDSEMSGRQLAEDKTGKTVIADYQVGVVQIDRSSKDQDEKASNEKHEMDQDKDDWSKDGEPNMEKQVAENNEFDQKSNDWSTETISDMTGASCTSRNAEKLNMAVMGVKTSDAGKNNEKTDNQNADSPLNNDEGVTCPPTLQRSRTSKKNQFAVNAFCTIEREPIIPYHDKDVVDGASSNQGGIASAHVQTKADVSSTTSGGLCTQMVQAGGDGSSSPGRVRTEDDGPLTPIGVEVEDPRIAVSSTSVEPSTPKKNLNGKQADRDGQAQDSEVVTSSGQSIEERRDVKSEISLEEYIEAQLQHDLSLPDISGSKSSETIPSLPPISFPSPTATSSVSSNSSLSSLKLPLSSSAIKFQTTDLKPAPSKVEKGEESKETLPAPSARGERSVGSPRMDLVRSLTAEYEQKIIAILQKRVDVEKAYREECAKIVNAVKALARKKKNMERELRDVLQTSLREISQKYISELQRFVRNETI